MPYDPTIYAGTAGYYAQGRPPYSRDLASVIAREVGLDGSGRLLDIGCGPGILTTLLADLFAEAIGLDPDAAMLAEGVERARLAGIDNIRWVQAVAEEIPDLALGTFQLVTFGQSFHWTDRERVAEVVYDILEPGGALALIIHTHAGRPRPKGPGYPPVPHDAIHALIDRYLGPRRRAGQGVARAPTDGDKEALSRTRFGAPRSIFCAGRPDIVQDIDAVLAGYFSMSFAVPPLFGDRREAFEAEVRADLALCSPSGLFWDWPGDTEILLCKPLR